MNLLREHIIFRVLWVIFAVHIFNCSIDSPDATSSFNPEDLSINDIETIYELILENFLEFPDAVSEQDEPGDEDSKGIHAKKLMDLYYYPFSVVEPSYNYDIVSEDYLFKDKYPQQFQPELTPPPPKA